MAQNQERKQAIKGQGRNHTQINGGDRLRVVYAATGSRVCGVGLTLIEMSALPPKADIRPPHCHVR